MKHRIIIILCILMLTGCVRIDNSTIEYDSLVKNVIYNHHGYTNEVGLGYQFLIPKGVKLIEDNFNNQVFLYNDTKIYIYVDITSYYYKNKINYKTNSINNEFYYKEFNYNNKEGFIQIEEKENVYYVKIVYNYAKVEVYANKDNLNNIISLSSIIIDSIDYNDIVIEKLLDDNKNNGTEITYKIDKPEGANGDFSQYLEEYISEDAEGEQQILPDE